MGPSVVARVAGSLAGTIAAAALVVGCSAPDITDAPRPDLARIPPVFGGAWWRTDLPVDGSFASLGVPTTGHVTIVRDGISGVRITLIDLAVDVPSDATLRVQLAGGDVTTPDSAANRRSAATYVPSGHPMEVGRMPAAAGTVVIELTDPQVLPFAIHSLVIVDGGSGIRLAAAELVPAG